MVEIRHIRELYMFLLHTFNFLIAYNCMEYFLIGDRHGLDKTHQGTVYVFITYS